jgi:prolyl-tRNA synthetase
MKDAYSFDLDEAGLRASYEAMFVAYLRTFARLGLSAVPVKAPTGPIGGDLSHEFHILAETGESAIFYDGALDEVTREELLSADSATIAKLTGLYAMEEEEHSKVADCPVPADRLRTRRGIEVGHIFAFGTKYSASMGLSLQTKEGGQVQPQMGSYGIGVSRLMGAIIEASHDERGIVWPESVAPYRVGLINMRSDDGNVTSAADEIYGRLAEAGVETLYDDRDERGGAKFATMDLIGLPWQLIVGPKGLEKGLVELKRRSSGEREELSIESALARLTEGSSPQRRLGPQ